MNKYRRSKIPVVFGAGRHRARAAKIVVPKTVDFGMSRNFAEPKRRSMTVRSRSPNKCLWCNPPDDRICLEGRTELKFQG